MSAEFERALIQERIKAGLARAKKSGTRSGMAIGRPKTSDDVEDRIRKLRAQGMGDAQDCGTDTVWRVVAGF